MDLPEGEPQAGQGEPSPEALAAGHRMLAAIVFTDTVGFSKLMSKDEERTMRLVARDLDQMKATCASFSGQVLKSTGDGLLMIFTSAVQAVACALEIQRTLHEKNQELAKSERLQHRIGIHLGDVFQSGNDVLGDGVNIAARLETQAVPGGICLSKTVFDVVHNRLPFYVNDLGPRKLKNIGTITAYQISPTNQGRNYARMAWRWSKTAGALVSVLAVIVVLYYAVYHTAASRQKHADDEIMKMAKQLDPSSNTIVPGTAPAAPPANFLPQRGKIAASDEDYELARFNYMTKYNFGAMIDWLESHDAPSTDEDKLDDVCKSMRALFGWCMIEIQNYSPAHPLELHKTSKGDEHFCWPNLSGGIVLHAGEGTPLSLPREQVPPTTFSQIMAALIRENARPNMNSTLQLWRGLGLFVQVYHVKPSDELQKDLDEAAAHDVAAANPPQVP